MQSVPQWFRPVVIVALLWNLLGCVAYLMDVTLTPEDIARMSAAEQALYAARPAWAVAAMAIAVWGGALGCLGLILRRRWSVPLLVASLAGLAVQNVALFGLMDVIATSGAGVIALQGLVLVIAVALVLLARKAADQGWLS